MYIHKEGYRTIAISFIVFAILSLLAFYFLSSSYPIISYLVVFLLFGLLLFIISFFRIPTRNKTNNNNAIVSPCDGKVVVIEEIEDVEYFKGEKCIQISVFMSPANVHVNLNPINGKCIYSQYHKGKYLVAWHPKSSTDNERHSVVLENEKGKILVKQIAGALAKRIVNYLKVGDPVTQNNELGFIKFGSRVDVLVPLSAKVTAKLGTPVKGGVDVLATW
jgi:phosphatidylserine decarboxylase